LIYEKYNYVGYKSSLRQKTAIYSIDEINSYEENQPKEHYRTIYRFDDSIKDLPSVREIPKDTMIYTDYIVIDIDSDTGMSPAIHLGKTLTDFLDAWEIGHELWFSGGKGFHVLIPTIQFGLEPNKASCCASVIKKMATELATASKIKIDSSIYNVSRVLRMPYSFNIKGNKHKVPVKWSGKTWTEHEGYPDPEDYVLNDKLVELYRAVLRDLNKKGIKIQSSNKSSVLSLWKPVQEGERNSSCYKVAKMWQERKLILEDTFNIMKIWNQANCSPPLTESEIKNVVQSAYATHATSIITDPKMSNYCYDSTRAVTRMLTEYKDFDKKVQKTGFKFFDEYTMGLMPGDLIFWLAVNGNFKSCVLSSLMQRMSAVSDKHTLLFSMDMLYDKASIRHMQYAESFTIAEVYRRIKAGYGFPKFKKMFNNVHIIDKKALTVDEMDSFINWFRNNVGEVGAIGVDYLGDFKGCDNDTVATGRTVHELSDLTGQVGCPTIALVQARREYEGAGGNVEIDKTAGKDASAIEQKCDYLIGSWWHWPNGPMGNKRHYGKFLKNRKFDSEKFKDNAVFTMQLDKEYMRLSGVEYEPEPPSFNQKKTYGG